MIQPHLDKILPALFRRMFAPVPLLALDQAAGRPRSSSAASAGAAQGAVRRLHRRSARAAGRADPTLREQPTNLIEAMLAARDARRQRHRPTATSSGNVLTMLLAGEDTTANTLAWMIWLLHRHPEALQRAADEVRAVLGARAAPTDARAAGAARLRRGLRARDDAAEAGGAAACRCRRCATRGRRRRGAGRHAGDVPDAARQRRASATSPSRGVRARALARGGRRRATGSAKRVAMPFGAGPRICPGRYLALLEIKMVMAMLLGRLRDRRGHHARRRGAAREHGASRWRRSG